MAVRYEHYETASSVVISVFRKGAKADEVDVQIGKSYVRVVVAKEEILVLQPLTEEVDVEQSTHRVSPIKIEITLSKLQPLQWSSLTRSPSSAASSSTAPVMAAVEPQETKPVAKGKKDWNKIVESEVDPKSETPNDFFAQIFSSATPEARRAMEKSYTESGGTTLSTNWEDVGARKVDVNPPEGMVERKWGQ